MRLPSRSRRLVLVISLTISLLAGIVLAQTTDEDGFPVGPLRGGLTYTLRYGDVIDLIAARYDVSTRCLLEINEIDNVFALQPGDTIQISDECPLYDGHAPVIYPRGQNAPLPTPRGDDQGGGVAPAGAGEAVYVIQEADVLDLVAAAFDEDLDCMVERNGFPRRYGPIFPGDAVIIPLSCPPYTGLSQMLPAGPGPQAADVEAALNAVGGAGGGVSDTSTGTGDAPPAATPLDSAVPPPTSENAGGEVPPRPTSVPLPTQAPAQATAQPTVEQPSVPPQQSTPLQSPNATAEALG